MSVHIVVGGQYGSEGKGKIAALLASADDVVACIRCGGPNSGHCFTDASGAVYKLRQIPTGFVNPLARLLIPAGAVVDVVLLQQELELLGLDSTRVGIDRNAVLVDDADKLLEAALQMRESISS